MLVQCSVSSIGCPRGTHHQLCHAPPLIAATGAWCARFCTFGGRDRTTTPLRCRRAPPARNRCAALPCQVPSFETSCEPARHMCPSISRVCAPSRVRDRRAGERVINGGFFSFFFEFESASRQPATATSCSAHAWTNFDMKPTAWMPPLNPYRSYDLLGLIASPGLIALSLTLCVEGYTTRV